MSTDQSTYKVQERTDLTGRIFGRWTVLSRDYSRVKLHWLCMCSCGVLGSITTYRLTKGISKSCGCYAADVASINKLKHGHSTRRKGKSAEYIIWKTIIQRCLNPNSSGYAKYGGRGITVAKVWVDSYEAFYDHLGPRPSKNHSVDRIDTTKGYEPGNVRWATSVQQANNRRNNKLISMGGKTQSLKMWARELNVEYEQVSSLISKKGLNPEEALMVEGLRPFRDFHQERKAKKAK